MTSHLFDDPRYAPIAWQDLSSGQHRGLDGKYFTTAFLHHPQELEPDLVEARFADIRVLAVEGPGWLLQDFEAQWADASQREIILEVVRRTEAEPSLLGASSHLMAIGYKPGTHGATVITLYALLATVCPGLGKTPDERLRSDDPRSNEDAIPC